MSLIASLALLMLAVLPAPASAWNIPGHMLSGIIAYQVLQQENPATIEKVKAVLEKPPCYANQWQGEASRGFPLPIMALTSTGHFVNSRERESISGLKLARWAKSDFLSIPIKDLEVHP